MAAPIAKLFSTQSSWRISIKGGQSPNSNPGLSVRQVREYQVDEEKQAEEEGANTQLADSAAEKQRRLEQWSTTAYGEVGVIAQHHPLKLQKLHMYG
jgi:hypothetical protein